MSTVKILIIEDDPLQAQEMAVFVRNAGYAVVGIVSNGERAIGLADTHQPDLLLCDVVLPGDLDGIQTAAIIRQTRNVPVVFLTNDRDPLTKQRIKRSGETYLPKPFTEPQLVDAMEFALLDGESEKPAPRDLLELNGSYFFHEYKTGKYRKVIAGDILYIQSKKHHAEVFLADKQHFTISIGISDLDAVFREPEIRRVHRSYIANTRRVESLKANRLYFPQSSRGIPIGDKYRSGLEEILLQSKK